MVFIIARSPVMQRKGGTVAAYRAKLPHQSPSSRCCAKWNVREENLRFILLAILMCIYMASGAAMFMLLEREGEIRGKEEYQNDIDTFLSTYPSVNRTDLEKLLEAQTEAVTSGYLNGTRARWDYAGSFYFVGTLVSTIGFGMTTPKTVAGRVTVIIYGLVGCSGAILFFNLFLERIITFVAYILRAVHKQRVQKRISLRSEDTGDANHTSKPEDKDTNDLAYWKPSVYSVMFILFLMATVLACVASAIYQPVESWSYLNSMYFCFVTFSTMGFGDFVISQNATYDYVYLYRFGNFCVIVLGTCSVYSLFNVTSIIIKQFLNWILKKIITRCCRIQELQQLHFRRNAIAPSDNGARSQEDKRPSIIDLEEYTDNQPTSRRASGELIAMNDLLKTSKQSVAMMQKQLYETSNKFRRNVSTSGIGGPVGPLAILNKTLGED